MDDERRDIAVTLLAWYRDMGVDAVLADAPVDWTLHGGRAPGESMRAMLQGIGAAPAPATPSSRQLAPSPQTTPAPRSAVVAKAAAPARAFTSKPPDAAETAARSAARSATSIQALATAIDAFDGCGLKATASRSCVYRGAGSARLMIIGDAPGREEDLEGKPFVGPAGRLLDKMLASIGLTEADVHITNIVYWRPPGNRTPTPQEAQVCRPFLERQVELVKPNVVVLLGDATAKHVLDVSDGIMRLRGTWKDLTMGQHRTRALPCLHPTFLLRTPAYKRQAWLDLLAVKAALAQSWLTRP